MSGEDFRNVVELFKWRVAKSASKTAYRHKAGGVWREQTFADWDRAATEIAAGLASLGLGAGDRVAIISGTRPEWIHADVGIALAGGVSVPIYQSSLAGECGYILRDSGARFAVVEDPQQIEKLLGERQLIPGLERVYYFDDVAHLEKPDKKGRKEVSLAEALAVAASGTAAGAATSAADWVRPLSSLCSEGAAYLAAHPGELEQRSSSLGFDDLCTLVYTSGTTGNPKGVMLTHEALVATCNAVRDVLPLTDADEQLLFLPLAHIFARMLAWSTVQTGCRLAFGESIAALVPNLSEVRPTFFASVPRIFEKVYIKVMANRAASSPAKQRIFDWALSVGKAVSKRQQARKPVPLLLELQRRLAEKLVYAKIHAIVGGRVRFMISGSAPLSREIAEFFHAVGLLVLEGYGLTETTAGSFFNRPDNFRFGTVGTVLPGMEQKLAEDGEILLRGAAVFRGYYQLPEATAEAFAPLPGDAPEAASARHRWFHTGDIGVVDDGFLRITDRKKDLIKTSGGKYIAPQNLENALKTTPYVSQVLIYGDNRPYVTALITLNEEAVRAYAKEHGLDGGDFAGLAANPQIRKLVESAVSELNRSQPSYATLKKFEILPADFTLESGELTPSLKMKRKFATEKYRGILDRLYES